MLAQRPILVGSIIHLENGQPNGGYLDTRGRVTEKPVITKFQDPRVRAFVFTHADENRAMGSGSWQVLSAGGKKLVGEPLESGDTIYLLNMYSGAGYLDTFEWMKNLEPFKTYPMTIGVFTASVPNRGGGLSGTWTIRAIGEDLTGTEKGKPLNDGDSIYLENEYPGAGFLQTYGDVTAHELFTEYDGQRFFVFTGPAAVADAARRWTIRLNHFADNLYRVQNQWGGSHAPWHDGGVFKIGDPAMASFSALSVASADKGETLAGTVTFAEEEAPTQDNFKATRRKQDAGDAKTAEKQVAARHRENIYDVETRPFNDDGPGDWRPVGDWRLGSREFQRIVHMELTTADDGHTLVGEITYEGEAPIRFKGLREAATTEVAGRLLYDYFHPDLLKGRTNRIEGVIDTTYKLLSTAFCEISATSLDEALDWTKQETETLHSNGPAEPIDPIDYGFQVKQLLNLHALSEIVNTFFRTTLQGLMKQSIENHQRNQTLAPLHLIRECFQHIATDHEIIQQATIQRRWAQGLNGDKSDAKHFVSDQAVELMIMDKLAIKAVAPFQHLLPGLADNLAIITYLSEKTHIHHVPYTDDCLLIGVSYDRVPPAASFFDDNQFLGRDFQAFELMAIPHEVGHYLYQHGRFDDGTTFSAVSKKFAGDNPYYRWCEEIFADVYGCIVAGPLSALGMQALLVSIDRGRAWKDDEEHPTPVLRMFILAEVLRVLQELASNTSTASDDKTSRYRASKVTEKLDEDWAEILNRWGYERMDAGKGRPERLYLPDDSHLSLDKLVNIKRVVQAVRPIIIEFATYLLNAAKSEQPTGRGDDALSTTIPWSRSDYVTSADYNDEMGGMSNRNFARKKVPNHNLLDANVHAIAPDASDPDEKLRHYLANWGDSGPFGWGGH